VTAKEILSTLVVPAVVSGMVSGGFGYWWSLKLEKAKRDFAEELQQSETTEKKRLDDDQRHIKFLEALERDVNDLENCVKSLAVFVRVGQPTGPQLSRIGQTMQRVAAALNDAMLRNTEIKKDLDELLTELTPVMARAAKSRRKADSELLVLIYNDKLADRFTKVMQDVSVERERRINRPRGRS
jgi:hypothetical protein